MPREDHGRKAGRNFASLRATFSRSTVSLSEDQSKASAKNTSRPAQEVFKVQTLPPLPSTKLPERRQSKYTLFDLFSKPKVQTARGYHETGLGSVPEQSPATKEPQSKEEKPKRVVERVDSKLVGVKISSIPPQPTYTPPVAQARPADCWSAPPLFQAYPQAIRHGTLQSPSASMDLLMRAQHMRNQVGFSGNATLLPAVQEGADGEAGQDAGKNASKRHSILNEAADLVDRIFVLVTAGRLVQYAGHGNYDRMPEKVLQLGEKSAAFACDLIPGKHWVVQVVQQMNADTGGQINKSRSILSRLRNPATVKKSSTNILLVFNSAEDMDAWLKAIRSVIEDLGGATRKDDGEARALDKSPTLVADDLPSHRYRVSRPPSMISTATSTHRPRSASSFSQPRSPKSPTIPGEEAPPPVPSSRHLSPHTSPSNSPREAHFPQEVQSLVRATAEVQTPELPRVSNDQNQLERLRDVSRTSIISTRTSRTSETENVTMPTSKCSSSPPSPLVESFVEQQTSVSTNPVRISYIAPSSDIYRPSVQTVSPVEMVEADEKSQVQQTVDMDATQETTETSEMKVVQPLSNTVASPRSRTSQLYSHTLPARLYTSDPSWRMSSQVMEPWVKPSRPDSVVGQLPSISTRSLSRMDSVSNPRRPLSRMLPVRPSESSPTTPANNGPGQAFLPRRYSSLPSNANNVATRTSPNIGSPETSTASSTPSSSSPDRSSRMSTPPMQRTRMPSLPISVNTTPSPPQPTTQQARALRRPTSLQIRSDPAPFLSQRRPSMAIRSSAPQVVTNSYFAGATPSNDFLPQSNPPVRAGSVVSQPNQPIESSQGLPTALSTHNIIPEAAPTRTVVATPPPIPAMNPNRPTIRARTSMPAMMLTSMPPPPPPPNMPLPSLPAHLGPPSLPPNMPLPSLPPNAPIPLRMSQAPSLPPNIPLPSLPPNIPLPSLPPSIPLPPVPGQAVAL